jgi:asparagine synthase (glutamine-hydrolysing)
MCGIAGIALSSTGPSPTEGEVRTMLPPLRHRGPDGDGVFVDPFVALGHTRLSIIDLAGGAQPIHNEDRSVWVTFNGEIFNYVELRVELEAAGHRFYTHTDTEVLVHGYEEWGDDLPHHLNGQFAIALWDAPRRRLTLLRDRPGILPLYYVNDGRRLRFASEVKSLLATMPCAPRLDPVALDQIFTGWSPVAPRTAFEGISELPPGHRLVLDAAGCRVDAYWTWQYPLAGDHDPRDEEVLVEELYALLADATRIRLRADVPVGAYLSGGLDSSALVSLIRTHSSAPLRTFSIGFESAEHDEQVHQQELVTHLGVEHTRTVCDTASIGEAFAATVRHAEMPILRTAPVPMRLLSAEVRRRDYKVVLTGEGADEVLGGYDIFKEAKIRRFWSRQTDSSWRPLLLKRLYPWLKTGGGQGLSYLRNFYGVGIEEPEAPLFSHLTRFQHTAQCKQFFSADFAAGLRERAEEAFATLIPPAATGWDPFHRAQQLEARSLLSGYLLSAQGDRMLMANSVEGRFPFLDHRVMEFAARLDPRLKMRVLNEKYVLKRAMRAHLPKSIVRRHKQPYRAPDIPAFFSGRPLPWMEELLSERKLREFGYFDPAKVSMLVNKARAGRATAFRDNMAFVGVLATQLWHHHFIERHQESRTPT